MLKNAVISKCGKYRYYLSRTWDLNLRRLAWIMLNPSTADAEQDDPTIRRCISFSKKFGYGSIEVINLFAFRATDPKELLTEKDPIGTENYKWLSECDAYDYIVAWGSNKFAIEWLKYNAVRLPSKMYCLGINKDGSPKHPLYVSSKTELREWKLNELVV